MFAHRSAEGYRMPRLALVEFPMAILQKKTHVQAVRGREASESTYWHVIVPVLLLAFLRGGFCVDRAKREGLLCEQGQITTNGLILSKDRGLPDRVMQH